MDVVCFAAAAWRWCLDDAITPTPTPTSSLVDDSFMIRYLTWFFAMIVVINTNRWLTIFITFIRAKSLVSEGAASDALAKTPKIVLWEMVFFIVVVGIFHVAFVVALVCV